MKLDFCHKSHIYTNCCTNLYFEFDKIFFLFQYFGLIARIFFLKNINGETLLLTLLDLMESFYKTEKSFIV